MSVSISASVSESASVSVSVSMSASVFARTGVTAYRLAKTHRIPYLDKSFSAKVTYI